MGADIKKLRNRIKSVGSTLHLTKAMGLVASSKIRRAMDAMNKGRQYENAVKNAIAPLLTSLECQKSPFMNGNENGKVCLVVIAGDRGLAGGYNANIFRALRDYPDAHVIPIGKRACEKFKTDIILAEDYTFADATNMAKTICDGFKAGKYSKVGILCTRYVSMLSQEACVKWMLPLVASKEKSSADVIYEPDEITMLNAAINEYVAGMLVSAARESFASEVAARRCAMDSAGKNAQEMIDNLQLEYNRARQGAITQEITEIVAGSGM